ncbi:MAG TPA: hypothetical protein VJT15_10140 [Pyrinomonadaceae bacterium]|nr:hypothetical protein [Pyrinomonadaceae bacterium]
MNNKKPTTRGVPPQLNRQAGSAQKFKPGVAQLKAPVAEQSVKRPVAPPVYRPQPMPKVLQAKSAITQKRNLAQSPSRPAPPSINRPEVKKIVQPKAIVQARKAPTPPPAYHSKQVKPVIQRARMGKEMKEPQPAKLEYDASSDATFCAMILYRHDLLKIEERYFASGNGHHAEEKAIARLVALVTAGTLAPQHAGGKDYIVYLAISKSPCSSESKPATRTDGAAGCLEQLTDLNDNGITVGAVTVTFAVQLAATKPYQGKVAGGKAASKDNYGDFGGDGGGSFAFVR